MKYILILIILFYTNIIYAQNTFELSVDTDVENFNDVAFCVLPVADGLVMSAANYPEYDAISLKVDYNGEILWINKTGYNGVPIHGGIELTQNNTTLVYAGYHIGETTRLNYTIELDGTGNIQDYAIIDTTFGHFLKGILPITEDIYVFPVLKPTGDGGGDIALTFYDYSLGEVIDRKFYDFHQYDYSGTLASTNDGGFVFTTYYPISVPFPPFPEIGSYTHDQLKVVRCNAVGDTLWTKNIPSAYTNRAFPDIVCLTNGNFVYNWVETYDGFDVIPYIGGLSADGDSLLWRHDFEVNRYPIVYGLHAAANGDVIGFGRTFLADDDNSKYAWVFRFSATGELLWERHFHEETEDSKLIEFTDIAETPDGRIACAGVNVRVNPLTGEGEEGDIYLLMIDADGCFNGHCGDYEEEEAIYLSAPEPGSIALTHDAYPLRITPNPVRSQAVVSYRLQAYQHAQLLLYNLQGQLQQQHQLPTAQQSHPLDLSQLPSGVYVYQLVVAGKQVKSGKVVVSE